jgi:regulator of sigma E protease
MGHVIDKLGPLLSFAVPGVLLLGIVIFVHELGHFLAAKAVGVTVLRFSLGFGPKLVGFQAGTTEYRVSWFPLGGYVQMAGDAPDESGHMPEGRDQYLSHPWPGRMLIAFAGPLANIITAVLVMTLVYVTGERSPDFDNVLGAVPDSSVAFQTGLRAGDRVIALDGRPIRSWDEIFLTNSSIDQHRPVRLRVARGPDSLEVELTSAQREPLFSSLHPPADPPVVAGVRTGMPAYKAGLQVGDRILAVDGDSVRTWDEMRAHIVQRADQTLRLTVDRSGQVFDVSVVPVNATGDKGGPGQIGIDRPTQRIYISRFPLGTSLKIGALMTVDMIGSVYRGMWLTVTRPLYYREYLGGPLFIAQAASEEAQRGADSFLKFLALINIAVMAFNLLPMPVLDGGHILLALIEAVFRRRISVRTYLNFQRVGLVVLGTLFLLILANDPWRLIQRRLAVGREPHSAPRERPVAPAPP